MSSINAEKCIGVDKTWEQDRKGQGEIKKKTKKGNCTQRIYRKLYSNINREKGSRGEMAKPLHEYLK